MSEQIVPANGRKSVCAGVLEADAFPRAHMTYDIYYRPLLATGDPDTYWLAALPLMAEYAEVALRATHSLLAAHGTTTPPGSTFSEHKDAPEQLRLFCDELATEREELLPGIIVNSVLGDMGRALRSVALRDVRELARLDRALARQTQIIQRVLEDEDAEALEDDLLAAGEFLTQALEQAGLMTWVPNAWWLRARAEVREQWLSQTGQPMQRVRSMTLEGVAVEAKVLHAMEAMGGPELRDTWEPTGGAQVEWHRE